MPNQHTPQSHSSATQKHPYEGSDVYPEGLHARSPYYRDEEDRFNARQAYDRDGRSASDSNPRHEPEPLEEEKEEPADTPKTVRSNQP